MRSFLLLYIFLFLVTKMKKIELPYATIENRDGILWLILKEDADLDVEEVKEFTSACEKLSGNEPYFLISDARVNLTISSEGRKAAASQQISPLLVANAVLVNNVAVRMVANFFTAVNKPHFKYKVFNNETEALAWLKDQV
jgi:hypothetical protein